MIIGNIRLQYLKRSNIIKAPSIKISQTVLAGIGTVRIIGRIH